jgi:hypothetical protein
VGTHWEPEKMKKNPLTADFQSGTRSVIQNYDFFVFYLIVDLCLIQGLNALKTSPWAFFLKPSLASTYVAYECCQTES